MEKLKTIVSFLNKYLDNYKFEDDSWNGLQVEGSGNIKKVAFCVTAGLDVFKEANKKGADMIIAHHGIFWKKANPSINGWMKERVSFLINNDISFYASHLPLDAHPKSGNNAQLMKILGAQIKEPMGFYGNNNIGWIGERSSISIEGIVEKLEKIIDSKPIVLKKGKDKVKKIAIVSGGAPYLVFEAIGKGVDLFITGDSADILEVVKDAKINVIFAGHYATETTGVKDLMTIVGKKFKVETFFINAPTGL